MGKITGFLEHGRESSRQIVLPSNAPQDWNEFHDHFPEKKLEEQAGRCMDCGIPFCHTGTLLSGMASGCPVNNLIPEWNDLVYRGLWQRRARPLAPDEQFS